MWTVHLFRHSAPELSTKSAKKLNYIEWEAAIVELAPPDLLWHSCWFRITNAVQTLWRNRIIHWKLCQKTIGSEWVDFILTDIMATEKLYQGSGFYAFVVISGAKYVVFCTDTVSTCELSWQLRTLFMFMPCMSATISFFSAHCQPFYWISIFILNLMSLPRFAH